MEEVFPVIFFNNILESEDGSEAVFNPFRGLQDQNLWFFEAVFCPFTGLQDQNV